MKLHFIRYSPNIRSPSKGGVFLSTFCREQGGERTIIVILSSFKLTSFRFEIFFLLGYNISIFYSFSSRWREVYKSANPRNQFNFPADYIPARDLRRGIRTFCRWGNSAEAARDKYFLRISRETD